MSPQAPQPRWYVHRNGETSGPHDEHTIIGWIKNGMRDGVVRSEVADPNSPWSPLAAHAPFAAALLPDVPSPLVGKRMGSNSRTAVLGIVLLVIVGLAIFLWLRALMGERGVETAFAAVVHTPVDVEDEIVSVPAQHCRGIPIQLPYSGQLTLAVTVLKGSHVNVYVVNDADWSEFAKAQTSFFGGRFHHYPAFQSTNATRAQTSAALGQGAYYVVLENPTFGVFVAPSFDVQVKATLQP